VPRARKTYTGTVEVEYVIYVGVEVKLHVFLTSAGGAVGLGKRKILSLLESNQHIVTTKPLAWSLF
jgi:hypothetical protein